MYRILLKIIITPPPLLAVDTAQAGEGLNFRICITRLEYKPRPALPSLLSLFNTHHTESTIVLSFNTATR